MAIRLSGTPQQQKAPFSAFDTSSNFQSGLTQVGQALQQAGAGQARVKQRAEVEAARVARESELEAARVARESEVAQNELDRKEKASQNLLAKETELRYSERVNEVKVELSQAIKLGNYQAIQDAQAKLNNLNPDGSGYNVNSYLPQNHRSELTNEDVIRETNIANKKLWGSTNTSLRVERINAENFTRSAAFTDQVSIDALDFVNENEDGVTNEELIASIDATVDAPIFESVRESTGIGTPRNQFDGLIKQSIIDRLLNQFENNAALTVDELDSRLKTAREILSDPKYRDAGVLFDVTDEEKIEAAYTKKLDEISDTGYQKEQAKASLSAADNSTSLLLNADVITTEATFNVLEPLLKVDADVLTTSQRDKRNSLVALHTMFLADQANPVPMAYAILERMAMLPESRGTTLATVLKDAYGDDFTKIGLASTEQSALSDWLTKNLKLLRDVGDSPQNLRYLSPYHDELIKRAMSGDKLAYKTAQKEYSDFVKSNADLASVAPPMFYVDQAPLPTQRVGDTKTYADGIATNVLFNGIVNAMSHASHELKQGDIQGMELLRYESEMLYANLLYSGLDQKKASDSVETLVKYHRSGKEFSKTTDSLYESIYLQSQKFDKQAAGDVLPLVSLIQTYTDRGLPDKAEYYNNILRGYVKTYESSLTELDDPEEQYEFIRDKLFDDVNIFPYVTATDSGSLVELPSEYNKYVDVKKDRTGFFGRFFEPVGRLLSDQESLKNVATVYSTAVISEMFEQNPSLNIDQIIRDIREEVAPDIELDLTDPYVSVYTGAIPTQETPEQKAEREEKLGLTTREALIRGLMNNQVDGKHLFRLTTELQSDDKGNPKKVAVLNVLKANGSYEPLARSSEDRSPISASLDKIDVVMNSAMERITTFSLGGTREDDAGVSTMMFGTPYYLSQLFGDNDAQIIPMVQSVHDQIYNKD